MKGYVQVYTGDGKGKTPAALGLALRAAGAGLRVYIAQFVKAEKYGEITALERFSDLITCRLCGSGCRLEGQPSDEDVQIAKSGLTDVRRIVTAGQYDVVILDEANIATHFGLLPVDDLIELIDLKPAGVELIFTGRKADPRLIERADLVSEMLEIKNCYHKGVPARKGIEN
ncbi:MAG: cob(I)yrinic acid a,c-diamide adenosyltransferase [Deltaproteobacteria bacterium]|jgi:cob(I)alamin adenosyltransferase|nr:cob(I)yrinic acid a,c-diamide adenosyltransferase [Deltaproteobacteria bacterium]